MRPCASWAVATPPAARPAVTAGPARRMLRYTTFIVRGLPKRSCRSLSRRSQPECQLQMEPAPELPGHLRRSLERRHVTAPFDPREDRAAGRRGDLLVLGERAPPVLAAAEHQGGATERLEQR